MAGSYTTPYACPLFLAVWPAQVLSGRIKRTVDEPTRLVLGIGLDDIEEARRV
jgi:hypothetical protein